VIPVADLDGAEPAYAGTPPKLVQISINYASDFQPRMREKPFSNRALPGPGAAAQSAPRSPRLGRGPGEGGGRGRREKEWKQTAKGQRRGRDGKEANEKNGREEVRMMGRQGKGRE